MSAGRTRMTVAVLALAAACSGGSDGSRAPAPDRLVALGNGAVLDSRTRLEWTSRDHEQSLPWEEADRYCRGLAAGGQREWRLPEIGELEALYDTRFDEPCGDRTCHLDPAIRVGGPYLWAVTSRGAGTRFYFDAAFGNSFSPSLSPRLVRRVICVRAAAEEQR